MSSNKIILPEATVDPPANSSGVRIYSKQASGIQQLFVRASDGTVNQLTPTSGLGTGTKRFDTTLTYTFSGGTGFTSNDINFGTLGQNTLVICNITAQRNSTYTGFVGGVDGMTLSLLRSDADTTNFATIPDDNAGSSAANRIYTPGAGVLGNYNWQAQGIINFIYIGYYSRWNLF